MIILEIPVMPYIFIFVACLTILTLPNVFDAARIGQTKSKGRVLKLNIK